MNFACPSLKTILLLALPQLLPPAYAFSDFYLYTARWFYGLLHTFRCDLEMHVHCNVHLEIWTLGHVTENILSRSISVYTTVAINVERFNALRRSKRWAERVSRRYIQG